MAKEIKELSPTVREFMANGVMYYRSDRLSIERYTLMQKFSLRDSLALTLPEFMKRLQGLIADLDKVIIHKEMILADYVSNIYNLIYSVRTLDAEYPIEAQFATLFFNREDEDVSIMTPELMKSKIHDWNVEGIGIDFFKGFFLESLKTFYGTSE